MHLKFQLTPSKTPTGYFCTKLIFSRLYSLQLDIYSFGVLLTEMCTGVMPIVQQREEQINRVRNGGLRNLIRRCIQRDPRQRPSAEELITYFADRI